MTSNWLPCCFRQEIWALIPSLTHEDFTHWGLGFSAAELSFTGTIPIFATCFVSPIHTKWRYPLIARNFTARPNNLLYSSIWMAIYEPLLGTNSLLSSVIVPDQPNSPAVRPRGYTNIQQITKDTRMWDTCYV